MMWRERLEERLRAQREAGRLRAVRGRAEGLVDLTSNDYLALREHVSISNAAVDSAAAYGVGAGASRLVGGSMACHVEVEARFAAFKESERALLLPTGYHANLSVLTALPSPGDLLLCDKLCHASLIDGARLAQAAHNVTLRTFPHKEYERAHELAQRHLAQSPEAAVWLVTDSVFSMDGDVADLRALAELRDSLDGRGALIVDEAHATGIIGPGGAGLDAQMGHAADVAVSTASKALGSLGGIITGPAGVCAAIENFARPFIYTTAVPPAQCAAIVKALDVIGREPERRERLVAISRRVREGLRERGWDAAPFDTDPTPIVPLVVGESERAVELSERLREAGFDAPAIRPPTVAPGTARVRLSLHAGLTDGEVAGLLRVLG